MAFKVQGALPFLLEFPVEGLAATALCFACRHWLEAVALRSERPFIIIITTGIIITS